MADFTEKEILIMIWQNLEDLREFNSSRRSDAIVWSNSSENPDKKSSRHHVADIGMQIHKNKTCLAYIENKLKNLSNDK